MRMAPLSVLVTPLPFLSICSPKPHKERREREREREKERERKKERERGSTTRCFDRLRDHIMIHTAHTPKATRHCLVTLVPPQHTMLQPTHPFRSLLGACYCYKKANCTVVQHHDTGLARSVRA